MKDKKIYIVLLSVLIVITYIHTVLAIGNNAIVDTTRKCSLKIVALNSDEGNLPLKGVKYSLYLLRETLETIERAEYDISSHYTKGHEETTDENGVIEFTELEQGCYYAKVISVPTGTAKIPESFIVNLPMTNLEGNSWDYDVEVKPKVDIAAGNVIVNKTDLAGKPLKNVIFKVQVNLADNEWVDYIPDGGSEVVTLSTDDNGQILLQNLPVSIIGEEAKYRLIELQSVNNEYIINNSNYSIIRVNSDGSVKISNRDTAAISGSIKTENINDIHIARVEVYNKNGILISKQNTQSDGTYQISVLPGTYDVVITKLGYLEYRVNDVIVEDIDDVAVIEEKKLVAGDTMKSGEIETDDLVFINDNFAKDTTEETLSCDLNEDGKINSKDRNLVKDNYGKLNETVIWSKSSTYNILRNSKNGTINLTNEKPIISKKVKGNLDVASANLTDSISFNITASVPTIINDMSTYVLSDTLPEGLTGRKNVIIKGFTAEGEETIPENAYTKNESEKILTVYFNPENISNYAAVKIIYDSNLDMNNATIGEQGNINTATLTYTNKINPEGEEESTVSISDIAKVVTGGIKIHKIDIENNNLQGAKFKIATSEENAKIGEYIKGIDGQDIEAITGNDGYVQVNGLAYNDDESGKKYWLVETQAPTYKENIDGKEITKSYKLLSSPLEIFVDGTSYTKDITVINKKEINLPLTGERKIVLFFAIGAITMIIAIVKGNKKQIVNS